jgi:hypothetical protein
LVGQSPENAAATPIGAHSPMDDVKSSSSESLPRLQTDEHKAARGPGKRPITLNSYPTTPYPQTDLPGMNSQLLPEVRTSDPAVARIRGDIEPLSR